MQHMVMYSRDDRLEVISVSGPQNGWIFNFPCCVYILLKRKLTAAFLQRTCTEIQRHTAGRVGAVFT